MDNDLASWGYFEGSTLAMATSGYWTLGEEPPPPPPPPPPPVRPTRGGSGGGTWHRKYVTVTYIEPEPYEPKPSPPVKERVEHVQEPVILPTTPAITFQGVLKRALIRHLKKKWPTYLLSIYRALKDDDTDDKI